jgi:hypothetical protein
MPTAVPSIPDLISIEDIGMQFSLKVDSIAEILAAHGVALIELSVPGSRRKVRLANRHQAYGAIAAQMAPEVTRKASLIPDQVAAQLSAQAEELETLRKQVEALAGAKS